MNQRLKIQSSKDQAELVAELERTAREQGESVRLISTKQLKS